MPNMNVNVTTANTQGNDLSPTMKEYYDTDLLENARPLLIFGQFAKKQPLPKNNGNRVEWRIFLPFAKALKPLTEGVTPDGNKLNMARIVGKIDQYGDYTTISDRLELEAVDPMIQGATEEHGAQAGATMDTLVRNEVLTGANVMYAGGKASRYALDGGDKITSHDVNRWNTFLKKMLAPKIDGCYVAIVHPSVTEDLREDPAWIEAHKYASPEEIFNGEVGKLHNIRFVETTEQKVYRGADLAAASRTLALSANASGSADVTIATGQVDPDALVGRLVLIKGVQYEVTANTATKITLADPLTGAAASVTASTGDIIYPGEGGKDGCAVYAVTIIGNDAYGTIDPSAESLQVIVKQRGSAGTADPLDQRSTVGWKASTGSKILYENRLLRFECGSSYSDIDEEN